MEDYISSDEDHYYSDRDSMDGLENDESDPLWVSAKGPTTKVFRFSVCFILLVK